MVTCNQLVLHATRGLITQRPLYSVYFELHSIFLVWNTIHLHLDVKMTVQFHSMLMKATSSLAESDLHPLTYFLWPTFKWIPWRRRRGRRRAICSADQQQQLRPKIGWNSSVTYLGVKQIGRTQKARLGNLLVVSTCKLHGSNGGLQVIGRSIQDCWHQGRAISWKDHATAPQGVIHLAMRSTNQLYLSKNMPGSTARWWLVHYELL